MMERKHKFYPVMLLAALLMIACEMYASFDVSKAEGVGLYFALKLNTPNRTIFDCLALLLDFLIMCGAIFIPIRVQKNRTPEAFLRCMTVWFGAVPLIDYSDLIWTVKESGIGMFSNLRDYVICFEKAITILLVGCIIWNFLLKEDCHKKVKKSAALLIAIAFALMIAAVFLYPEVGVLKWFVYYLFAVAFFILSEECITVYTGLEKYIWIVNAMFFFMGLLMRITKTGHY